MTTTLAMATPIMTGQNPNRITWDQPRVKPWDITSCSESALKGPHIPAQIKPWGFTSSLATPVQVRA
jgi:hypothetical protein